MAIKLTNNAKGALATSISASDTTIALMPADAIVFPDISGDDWFPLTIVKADGQFEIVRCTDKSGPVLTVQRGQEGTSPKAFNAGDRVEMRMTANTFFHAVEDSIGTQIAALNLGDASTRNVGTTSGTVAAGDDSRIVGALQKSHNLGDVQDKAQARDNLGLAVFATRAPAYEEVTEKPDTFPPGAHTHPWDQITGAPAQATRWPAWGEVTGRPATADRWPTWAEVTGKPATFAPAAHTHTWAQISGAPAQATRWPTWAEVSGKPATFQPVNSYLAVGTYAYVNTTSGEAHYAPGTNVAGSLLSAGSGGTPSGTWTIMGKTIRSYRSGTGSGSSTVREPGLAMRIA